MSRDIELITGKIRLVLTQVGAAALLSANKMLSRDAKNSATCEPINPQLTNTSSRV